MTDPAIIAASYAAERNYSHNPDDVIDASDAVGAWGTAKESTTELVDLSGNGNIADIHGAMPTEGFIQGRRFTAANSNYLDCGNDSSLDINGDVTFIALIKTTDLNGGLISKFDSIAPYDGYSFSVGAGSTTGKLAYFPGNFPTRGWVEGNTTINDNILHVGIISVNSSNAHIYLDGILENSPTSFHPTISTDSLIIGKQSVASREYDGIIYLALLYSEYYTSAQVENFYNILARLPFWSVNYTDYPDNVTEYTDNLPYSSTIIQSGTFKVDDDMLQCVSAGTITYSASYEFDGSEYIKMTIDGVEYAGTGTITQGNTTVSVAQGSNKVTIEAGTGDSIDSIDIQFRAEV